MRHSGGMAHGEASDTAEQSADPGPDGPLGDARVLGARLRELRSDRGMSLRDVAERLGISTSAVSQIERGVLRPSVNRLLALTGALGVPLADVFGSESPALPAPIPDTASGYTVSRADDVLPVDLAGGVVFSRLSPAHTEGVDFFESVYPPHTGGGARGELLVHEGYEVGTVTSGVLTVEFDGERVDLAAGDSITFRCEVPHLIGNETDEPAVATWLIVHGGAGARPVAHREG